ncbi:hypothetical protein CGZ94_05615, partial [Enemella evansiae]
MNSLTSTGQPAAPRQGRSRAASANHATTACTSSARSSSTSARICRQNVILGRGLPRTGGLVTYSASMGGLFHPIGPEAEETYWLRRGAVLIVLVAVLVGAGFMISSISQAISGPAQPAAAPPADPAAPAPVFADALGRAQAGWRTVVSAAVASGVPVPAFSTSLAYYDAL